MLNIKETMKLLNMPVYLEMLMMMVNLNYLQI